MKQRPLVRALAPRRPYGLATRHSQADERPHPLLTDCLWVDGETLAWNGCKHAASQSRSITDPLKHIFGPYFQAERVIRR